MSSRLSTPGTLAGVLSVGFCALILLPWQALSSDTEKASDLSEKLTIAQEVYDDNCAACHGYDGVPMLPGAANFAKINGLEKSDSELLKIILDGKGEMPEWRDVLTEEEQVAALAYSRLFTGQHVVKENCGSCHNEAPHELLGHSLGEDAERGTSDTAEICPGSDIEAKLNRQDSVEIDRYRKRLAELGGLE